MAWQEGYLVFSGEPLSEVIAQVNRYSPVALEVADPKLASRAIGGRFRIGDLDAVLDVLHTDFGIQSSRVDERTIRLEPSQSR
jgi:transmembrane sensor